MRSDASETSTGDRDAPTSSFRLQLLPLVYGIATVSTVIVAAMYGAVGDFFLEVGDRRAAAVFGIAVLGTLGLAGASLAATIGLARRARWSWFLAVAIAAVWTANGIRVLLVRGLYLPASLVIGLVVLWVLWDVRGHFGADIDVS